MIARLAMALACAALWLAGPVAAQPSDDIPKAAGDTAPDAPAEPDPAPIVPPIVAPIVDAPPTEPTVTELPGAPVPASPQPSRFTRSLAGSVQLDYLAVPTDRRVRRGALDGASVELSLKLAVDIGRHTANVKVCVACHGPEFGMANVELRAFDELNARVGRFTPSFGSFPIRHDPANHRTSDKPLPYDMGRMLEYQEWNEGILPAPWVDNGLEIFGSHFIGAHQIDYAAYAIGGPKGTADRGDFDYTLSRSGERYYIDNNSQPTVGGRFGLTLRLSADSLLSLGASTMAGHYDPDARLGFLITGADLVLQLGRLFLRAEYLGRWTEIDTQSASRYKYALPDNNEDAFVFKDGFYAELEVPVGRVDLIARWDGLRRFGNVLATSSLRSRSVVLRYTAGAAIGIGHGMRIKTSVEAYDFSDLDDQLAIHVGLVGSF
ncbi:MAG: hypothetical protein ACKV2T_22630 [Kofleriaceae bacterium]